jgi:hypothetical protein
MGLFGKSKKQLEKENQLLKQMLISEANKPKKTTTQKKKQVLYQCRYCGYKSIRNATEGAPLPGVNNCPRHPKGVHKGPHSWMRTYL